MRRPTIVAGLTAGATGLLGIAWFALYLAQPILGFADTDDPALGVRFVRAHPEVYSTEGTLLLLTSIVLTIAVASSATVVRQARSSWAVRSASAFGQFAAICLLVFGVLRIAAVSPLLHIANLDPKWGETAYLVVQMAGVQGFLPVGLLALALWAVGISLLGVRTKVLPVAVCVIGIVPAIHVAGRMVGHLNLLPDETWILQVASIPGTLAWCVLLGSALLIRGLRMRDDRVSNASAELSEPLSV